MRIVVGISDLKVSNQPEDVLVTYSLGSCIGLLIWDPVVKVGGLLHYMLPNAALDQKRAAERPFMFGSTGIPLLFKEAYKYGAVKNRIVIKVFGGAQIMDASGFFSIGKRNYEVLQKLFQKNGVVIAREEVGGTVNRTVSLEVGTGITRLKTSGREEIIL